MNFHNFSRFGTTLILLAFFCLYLAQPVRGTVSPPPQARGQGAKSGASTKAIESQLEKTKELQKRYQKLMTETTNDLAKLSAEVLAGKTGDLDKAVKKVKQVYDVLQSSYGGTQSTMQRNYWLALSQFLEGGSTFVEVYLDANPEFKISEYGVALTAMTETVGVFGRVGNTLEAMSLTKQLVAYKQANDSFGKSINQLEALLSALKQNELASQSGEDDRLSQIDSGNEGSPASLPASIDKLSKTINMLKDSESGLIIMDPDRGIVDIKQVPNYTSLDK